MRVSNKLTLTTFFVIILVAVTAFIVWTLVGVKEIYLVIDGDEKVVKTSEENLGAFLEEQGITLSEHDEISKSLEATLIDQDKIMIHYAVPVLIKVEGKNELVYTTADSVKDVLLEQKIELGPEDEVSPLLDAQVKDNLEIKVTRIETFVEAEQSSISYDVVTVEDSTLQEGKEKVVQEGIEGVLLTKTEKVKKDGKVVSEDIIQEVVQIESTDHIIAKGTLKPIAKLTASSPNVAEVTVNGITFSYKKVLNNVKLTAYDAGFNSTGKTEDHPQYGITYTGTTVKEGHTVAVDPNVIPLGWWIYIEGYGFRRAEDIGSAVKGKKVDIYFEDEDFVDGFGLKKGYTVYVIGPEKP
ncbi:3D domain-containing protein [Chengkuizengella axinellae]|uniref:Ubiquitin-like domain-containing protein n=1 Tax=Chengkuizengella axinellae TaxID=3064388 RepID=A0ABT9J5Q5_9BACL|nr:3D domain-containing protein [Chengkuizengella sp. 2205SS18-9]MDP5276935.1 ubiquitin-like domain-containing protein [Chengkuizengella sp. 2205SS18-9]